MSPHGLSILNIYGETPNIFSWSLFADVFWACDFSCVIHHPHGVAS